MELIEKLKRKEELIWYNPNYKNFEEVKGNLPLNLEDILDAEERLKRFVPYISRVFPEVKNGVIESEIDEIPNMKSRMEESFETSISGRLFLKRDDSLPIAGSIKARGGIYEVLKYAEKLAIEAGLLKYEDNYEILADESFIDFFSNYTIQVGSTGNLGLSIGTISAKVGFKVIVHMSSDAKKWKKDMLRSRGVTVVEYDHDFSTAVTEGRALSNQDPNSHFIDDENSNDLFMGYAVGGMRVKKQLESKGITIDENRKLVVYLPCGVGGGPGGVTYGLKLAYGDNVECYFAEPTRSPAMLLGLATGKHDEISVGDIGLDNKTEADGLAVGRPSSFVGKIMDDLLTGSFTIDDDRLFDFLKDLKKQEDIFLEPSAFAGFLGPIFTREKYKDEDTIQLCWGTGGSLVPEESRKEFLSK